MKIEAIDSKNRSSKFIRTFSGDKSFFSMVKFDAENDGSLVEKSFHFLL